MFTKPRILMLSIIFFTLTLIVHFPLLRFGLTGDHLGAIYDWRLRFVVVSTTSFRGFVSPYGVSAIIDKLIDWIWGFNAFPYFFIALLTKVASVISLYYLSKHFFKSRFIPFITSLIFMTTFTGLEALTAGATVYISLVLTSIAFIKLFILYDRKPKKIIYKNSIKILLLLTASFIITPTRMYGIIPMLAIAEGLALYFHKTSFKEVIIRLGGFLIIFIYIKHIGLVDSTGTAANVATTINSISYYEKVSSIPGLIVSMLGANSQSFLPDVLVNTLVTLGYSLHISSITAYGFAFILGLPIYYLTYKINLSKKVSILSFFFNYLLVLLLATGLKTQPSTSQLNIYIGGVTTNILINTMLYLWRTKNKLFHSAAVFFGMPIISMIIPYLFYPLSPQHTFSRYFAVSAYFAALIIGYLLLLIKKSNIRVFKVSVIILIAAIIYDSLVIFNYYKSSGEKGLYNKYILSGFNVMNNEIGDRHHKPRPLVYVNNDDNDFMHYILDRGDLRFNLANNNLSENASPWFVTDKGELTQIFEGNEFPRITDINAVYGFEIKNKQVYSITPEIRDYLTKEVHSN